MIFKSLMKYNILGDLRKDSKNFISNDKNDHHKEVFSLFVYPNISRNRFAAVFFAASCGLLLGGCGGQQVREDEDLKKYTDQSSDVFAPEPVSSGAVDEQGQAEGSQATNSFGGWSIVVAKVVGGSMSHAQQKLEVIQNQAGLRDAFIDTRSGQLVIAYGDYLSKADPRAIKDLERIRKMDLMGVKLFESALIMPPTSEALHGSNPMNDLRTAKERYGKQAVYTLQIGVYGRTDYQAPSAEDLASLRKAAENAVRELRLEGVMAFYYHAPARSMVTVGIFGERDFDASTLPPTQSLEMRRIREQFPNNLLNGQGINETVRTESGKTTRLQSSQLVAIPDK